MKNEIPAVIQTIVDQLGGPRVFAMAFDSMVYDTVDMTTDRPESSGVAGASFSIARGLRRGTVGRATRVIVNLMPDDTYTVITWRAPTLRESMRGEFGEEVGRTSCVYADQLRAVVESATGLRMTL